MDREELFGEEVFWHPLLSDLAEELISNFLDKCLNDTSFMKRVNLLLKRLYRHSPPAQEAIEVSFLETILFDLRYQKNRRAVYIELKNKLDASFRERLTKLESYYD